MKIDSILKKLGISSLALVCATTFPLTALAERAHLLGQTTLTYAENDIDRLMLGSCSGPRQQVRSIKVRAIRGSADIRLLRVRFGNGEMQNLPVRHNIAQGKESGWIDLRGKDRCVRSITIVGDTDNRSKRHAVVQIYGQ